MDAITVLVLADPAEPQLAMLEALPDSTTVAVGNMPEAFERTASQADVILNCGDGKLLREVWPMAPRVRWVHVCSAGLDRMLFPELIASPVPLTNARGVFSGVLAEFAIGAVLFFAKGFRRMVLSQKAGQSVAQAHLRHLNPFPANLADVLSRYDKVLVPEINLGQLALLLRGRFLVDVISYNQVRGLPFQAAELAGVIEDVIEHA